MKHYHVENHSKQCRGTWCADYPETFMFYARGNFMLVTYFGCMESYGHLNFKETLLKSFTESRKDLYEVRRGRHVDHDFKESRLRGACINTMVDEVNHLYYDNARKEYAFTTKVDLLEFPDGDEITQKYKEAKEYLEKNGMSDLTRKLKDLYKQNLYVSYHDSAELHKSIDNVIKKISKQIKQIK